MNFTTSEVNSIIFLKNKANNKNDIIEKFTNVNPIIY